jgi:hypothetical protein
MLWKFPQHQQKPQTEQDVARDVIIVHDRVKSVDYPV